MVDLEKEIRVREEFLSMLSHELRSPMMALETQLDVLRNGILSGKSYSEDELLRITDLAQRQVRRLNRQVNSTLELTRSGGGRVELKREPADLVELARSTVSAFASELKMSSATIEIRSHQAECPAKIDRDRMELVFTHLISNALQHGGGCVFISFQSLEASVIVDVQDEGPGVAAEDRERIFERFVRGHGASGKGLGLGLFLARTLVEAHRGTLELVMSTPGQVGATFRMRIPVR